MVRKTDICFNTAIITYPSDYNGMLTCNSILDYYKSNKLISTTTKIALAQEDPDEDITRVHFHLYWDDVNRKQVSTKYFDIPLEYPMVVFIHDDKSREYSILSELESQLGWDDGAEMVAKLDEYAKEKGYKDYEVLKVAHPNIQLRKDYIGSKYEMLRYVLKQKLITRPKKLDIDEELNWLLDNKEELEEKLKFLIEEEKVIAVNEVKAIDECIYLLNDLKQKKERKSKSSPNRKRGRKPRGAIDENTKEFLEKLRKLVLENKRTKAEILSMIKKDENAWSIFSTNYLNYNKLINDMFKNRPPSKPKRNYNCKFYLPRKLYDYIIWLDDWVKRWMTGEEMESRPKGLIVIGPSRTGKTSLISLLGDFSYFKNIWNSDNWEGLTAFNVMDDMDAGDEGKGLSFCWFKPFFGAQDAITITDKFKPKQDIINGKPLIWLNNYDYKETFPSKTAQQYIECNMEIVYLHKPLFDEPIEWIEGHSDYIEFDPKTTWYYQNVVVQKKQNVRVPARSHTSQNTECIFVDETEKIVEHFEEIEPLSDRKERLQKENEASTSEAGRPSKRTRTEN